MGAVEGRRTETRDTHHGPTPADAGGLGAEYGAESVCSADDDGQLQPHEKLPARREKDGVKRGGLTAAPFFSLHHGNTYMMMMTTTMKKKIALQVVTAITMVRMPTSRWPIYGAAEWVAKTHPDTLPATTGELLL
jgi:hypothetical protein